MNNTKEYLFVYGTLCRSAIDSKHDYLLPEASFISTATLQARLYLVGDYPGVIDSKDPNDKVTGELYEVEHSARLFARLDHYEGCDPDFPEPQEYKRVKRDVLDDHGRTTQAWIYLFNLSTDDLLHIESGDFAAFQAP